MQFKPLHSFQYFSCRLLLQLLHGALAITTSSLSVTLAFEYLCVKGPYLISARHLCILINHSVQ